jgi:hypothetical protein
LCAKFSNLSNCPSCCSYPRVNGSTKVVNIGCFQMLLMLLL